MRRGALAAAAVAGLALAVPAAAAAATPGTTSVFAPVPAPGYPAHAYVHPDGRVYEGTYVDHDAKGVPSKVFEFGAGGGRPTRTWTVPGQDTSEGEQGVQVATSDARGRLLLLDRTPARALLLDRDTGRFTTYARFPDLPSCTTVPYHVDCETGTSDEKPMPNYGLWLPDGSLLVTDYQQDVVWRVPAGGGTPSVWLRTDRFRADEFGLAGLALSADRSTVYLTQASALGSPDPEPAQGHLYAIPLLPGLLPGTIRNLWTSGPIDLPDGIAVSRSGAVYVALVGASMQIVRVAPGGGETGRFGVPVTGLNGSPVPFDGPSSVAFQGTRVLVANQSPIFGDASHQAILAVETGEQGVPELVPRGAGTAPAAPAAPVAATTPLRLTAAPKRLVAGRRTTLRLRVTAVVGGRRVGIRGARVRLVGRRVRTRANGRVTVRVRRPRAGVLRISATAPGHRSTAVRLRVLRRR